MYGLFEKTENVIKDGYFHTGDKGEFDEEFSEWDSFERQDYLSEKFFKDEEELNSDDWFGGMDEEYEEADWETEAMFKTLEEARKCEKELIEEI